MDGFTAHGEVRLAGGRIGGQLNLSGASLTNPGGPALSANRLTVGHSMLCGAGFLARGEVRLADDPSVILADARGVFLRVPKEYQKEAAENYPGAEEFFKM